MRIFGSSESPAGTRKETQTVFHIRYAGRTFEIKPKVFELSLKATDREIMARVADWLGVPENGLKNYVIDRRPSGQVVVRPEAIFG